MRDVYALDVETSSTDPSMSTYAALEPWRLRQGKARIDSLAVCGPDGVTQVVNNGSSWIDQVKDILFSLRGQTVYCHFAVFDVAWLISQVEPSKFRPVPELIRDIKWRDTVLLAKWLVNGQTAEKANLSYSLANLCKVFLKGHPRLAEFLAIKGIDATAGEDDDYWQSRGVLDVIMTRDLAIFLQSRLPEVQRGGFMTECTNIIPVANSWINGIRIDTGKIDQVHSTFKSKMLDACNDLTIEAPVLNSPKQLAVLLYSNWGIKPRTPNANGGSVSKEDLLFTEYDLRDTNPSIAAKLLKVIEYKKYRTLESKYIDTMYKALAHTGDGYIYGKPKIFGTYTGRMTYSNTTLKKKFHISIALHQLPRKEMSIRGLLIAPDGYEVTEVDASGQEARLMAIRSGDPTMLKIFFDGLNFHSMTGASICGLDYESFMMEYIKAKSGDFYYEQRQLGKLTNLSCLYRISGPALARKAYVDYDTYMTAGTGRFLVSTFVKKYTGVPDYWRDVIRFARENGYTETFGNRRYKITDWAEKSWVSESSAINFPIQSGGASMKEIAVHKIDTEFSDSFFCLDLHDASFVYTPLERSHERFDDLVHTLDSIDYEPYWGFKPPIPLTYEGGHGRSFKDVK